jgi:hypothetical protein
MLKTHSEEGGNPASDPAILWVVSTPRSFQAASVKITGAAAEMCISMAHDEFLHCLASVPLFSNCSKRQLQEIAKMNLSCREGCRWSPDTSPRRKRSAADHLEKNRHTDFASVRGRTSVRSRS